MYLFLTTFCHLMTIEVYFFRNNCIVLNGQNTKKKRLYIRDIVYQINNLNSNEIPIICSIMVLYYYIYINIKIVIIIVICSYIL